MNEYGVKLFEKHSDTFGFDGLCVVEEVGSVGKMLHGSLVIREMMTYTVKNKGIGVSLADDKKAAKAMVFAIKDGHDIYEYVPGKYAKATLKKQGYLK